MSLRSIAESGYAVWRGSRRNRTPIPRHWDELSEEERDCFTSVAAHALAHGAELQRRSQEQNDFIDEIEASMKADELADHRDSFGDR